MLYSLYGVEGGSEGFVVAGICDNDIVLSDRWEVGSSDEKLLQFGNVLVVLGRNEDVARIFGE